MGKRVDAWWMLLLLPAFIAGTAYEYAILEGKDPDASRTFGEAYNDGYVHGKSDGFHDGFHEGAGWTSVVCDPYSMGLILCTVGIALAFIVSLSAGFAIGTAAAKRVTKARQET